MEQPTKPPSSKPPQRDFLTHLETYLAKRDGVDKLLKISRYAAKLILSSSSLPLSPSQKTHLKSFESSVGLSRKAFRLGKFIQDVNSLRNSVIDSAQDLILIVLAYGGEGVYYFIEQYVWLVKSGLIDGKDLIFMQKISAWCEFLGYFGSVGLKIRELKRVGEDERCLVSSIRVSGLRGIGCEEDRMRLRKVREKKMLKRLSVVQDLADGLMALADIRDGKGRFTGPLVLSSAGLLSAVISTHKNWLSC
ncbi:peroxisomal membrane protein 11A [Apium graveolens]|uniref:peroxisomal membrane protein 11A n=1 Tax=Apium graveolens TaxID=4045 RepID=UPI003D78C38B